MVGSRLRTALVLIGSVVALSLGAEAASAASNPGTGDTGFFTFPVSSPDGTVKVNVASGNLFVETEDLGDADPTYHVMLKRFYNSLSAADDGILGPRWTFQVDPKVELIDHGGSVTIVGPSGYRLVATKDADDEYSLPSDSNGELTKSDTGWTLRRLVEGDEFVFDAAGKLTGTTDSEGRAFGTQSTSAGGKTVLSSYGDQNGRRANFSYNGDGHVREIDDPASGHRYYGYTSGRLSSYSGPNGAQATYGYDAGGRINQIAQASGDVISTINDAAGRVSSFTVTESGASPETTSFDYSVPYQTTVTYPNGSTQVFTYDDDYRVIGSGLDDGSVNVGDRLYELSDVDGDSQADVVMVNRQTGAIAVAAGAGDGTFNAEASWGTFGAPIDKIATGDIDGTDRDDPAGASARVPDLVARTTSGQLLIRLSTGAAFVSPPPADPNGTQVTWPAGRSLGLADVDGDGAEDLWGVDDATRALRIGYSQGSSFGDSTTWSTIPATRDVLMSDLDGDGLADLVTYEPSDGVVRFHQSDGENLAATDTWGQGVSDADFATGDINGDGLDDAVFRKAGSAGAVTARLSSRNEGFVGGSQDLGSLVPAFALGVVDLTGDVSADVVGTRVDDGELLLRSSASMVPDLEESDPRPADSDPSEDVERQGVSAQAVKKAQLMMGDDAALWYGDGIVGKTPAQMLNQFKYLGAERIRTIVWWGMTDRLRTGDEASLVPVGTGDAPAQTEASPPASPRVVRLARDETRPGSDVVNDPAPEWIANPAVGSAGHNPALKAGGEWVVIQDRFYVGPMNNAIQHIKDAGLPAHVTISGGTAGFTQCPDNGRAVPRDPGNRAHNLQVRACETGGDRTGTNPDPERAGHAIASIAEILRATFGSTIGSVGVWNEPNLTSSTFLSRPNPQGGQELDRSALYGRIYAYTWKQLDKRNQLGGFRLAFGELTSGKTSNPGETRSLTRRSRFPDEWATDALRAARDAPAVAWPTVGGVEVVEASILAIHPYQHDSRPWSISRRYPWGVHGLGVPTERTRGSKRKTPSLKGYLDTRASDDSLILRKRNATKATPPTIWATEFGYFTTKGLKEGAKLSYGTESMQHSFREQQRSKNLTHDSKASPGALNSMSQTGRTETVGFWSALESPPGSIAPGSTSVNDDYGFIGSSDTQTHPSYTTLSDNSAFGGSTYDGAQQVLRVTGMRPYGRAIKPKTFKKGTSTVRKKRYDGLQWPQQRSVACAIGRWAGLVGSPTAGTGTCP